MIGGTAHVEMPVSEIWKILEGGTGLMKELMTPFQKHIYDTVFGKLFEIKTIKADLIFRGEQILQGIYEVAMDYTFVHKDGAEEKGIFKLEGKKAIVMAHVELPSFEIFELKTIKADINFNGEQILHGIYDVTVHYSFVHNDGTEEKVRFMLEGKKAIVKVNVELPVSGTWTKLELGTSLLTELMTPVQKRVYEKIFGMLYEIKFIKADIILNGEQILQGMYNIAMDYTFVHKDGTEEMGTFMVQGKKETGMLITSVEVISKTLETVTNQIIYPSQTTIVCNWLTHDITVTGTFCKIFVNLAISENGITARGVFEYLDHQYECSSVLSISEKFFTMTYQEPGEQPKSLVVNFKVVNNCPTIEISGLRSATKWFKVGEFKTELVQHSLFDYKIKHTYNGMEVLNFHVKLTKGKMDMKLLYTTEITHTFHMIVKYTNKKVTLVFPKKNTWLNGNKNLEMKLEYQPTKEESPLAGGNIKMVAMREYVPFFKFGGYIGLTINHANYELLFNEFYVTVVDPLMFNEILIIFNINKDNVCTTFDWCFIEVEFNGKVFIDRINKNGFLNKMAVEAKALKDKKEVFNFIFTTVETPELRIFCPFLLKNVLNIQHIDHLEIKLDRVVTGEENSITISWNYNELKFVAKITPTMVAYELLVGQVSHLKHIQEFKIENSEKSFLLAGKSELLITEKSYIYKFLYFLSPTYACFKDITTDYRFEVVVKAAGKVKVSVSGVKDTLEMYQLKINNVNAPYKFILKAPYLVNSLMESSAGVPLINIECQHLMKELKISIINKTYRLKMNTIGNNKYEVNVNGETFVHLVLGMNQIEIITQHKNIPAFTTIITFKTLSIFENTVGIQILYKQIAHKIIFVWNMNKLAKAFVEMQFTGSGTTLLGEYELFHHLNWNIIDIKNMDLMWNTKSFITGLPYLNTPLLGDGKILLKDNVIDMMVVEHLKKETYTLIFKTNPLKIALLPFFEFP